MGFPLPSWARALPTPAPPAWVRLGLGPRLAALAEAVPSGAAVADVGADHALLAEALLRSGRVPRAIATDRASAPLDAARTRLEGRRPVPELRLGEGLAPLAAGEVRTLVLAGFGARKMREVLEEGDAPGLGVQDVIVQPTAGLPGLRTWLSSQGYELAGESVVREGDRGFITSAWRWTARPSEMVGLAALLGGLEASHPLLRAWLLAQRDHLARQGARKAGLLRELDAWLEEQVVTGGS